MTKKDTDRTISLSLELRHSKDTSPNLFHTIKDKFLNFNYSRNGILTLGKKIYQNENQIYIFIILND